MRRISRSSRGRWTGAQGAARAHAELAAVRAHACSSPPPPPPSPPLSSPAPASSSSPGGPRRPCPPSTPGPGSRLGRGWTHPPPRAAPHHAAPPALAPGPTPAAPQPSRTQKASGPRLPRRLRTAGGRRSRPAVQRLTGQAPSPSPTQIKTCAADAPCPHQVHWILDIQG
jgi:hypothetical protein